MFVREKRIGAYSYLYLVETVRENGKTKQRIVRNLGRKEMVEARGDLDRLARSAARLSQRSMILSLIEDVSAPLLFERLWRDSGCRAVVEELLAGRRFEFAVERAVFLTVLHRLMVSGSDRACENWRDDYRIDCIDELELHHLYRAMIWLGEELAASEQAGRTLVPRCVKDLIEERLFTRRRDLFSDLSVVFMDTTSLYFEGRGGKTLGQNGHSKDYRPHLKQMIVGIIMDQDGRPVCSEMWPGNTTDVTTLIPVIDRLWQRFAIGRVCVVADRGMISAETIAGLEERRLEYILGVRERSSKEVYDVVLKDPKPSIPLVIPRPRRPDTELEAKELWVGPALVFERLWEETGCRAVIEKLAGERKHGFALERAVFLTVLHRLFAGGSDRAADRWREDYRINGVEGLDLHHLYRAMAWLGEELPASEQDNRTPFAPRCLKDVVEERLFAKRRDLFTKLDLVFMDTTSLYFEGAGGQTLGRRGYSKDHRPDLRQMILAVLLDGDGRPVCTEMWPGNTADTGSLVPVVDRLRQRFSIGRVCIVADRGMISAETIAELEARGLFYILGVRERIDKLVRELVLDDPDPFVPLAITKRGKSVNYEAKAVALAGRRYIVCRNHEEAKKDAGSGQVSPARRARRR